MLDCVVLIATDRFDKTRRLLRLWIIKVQSQLQKMVDSMLGQNILTYNAADYKLCIALLMTKMHTFLQRYWKRRNVSNSLHDWIWWRELNLRNSKAIFSFEIVSKELQSIKVFMLCNSKWKSVFVDPFLIKLKRHFLRKVRKVLSDNEIHCYSYKHFYQVPFCYCFRLFSFIGWLTTNWKWTFNKRWLPNLLWLLTFYLLFLSNIRTREKLLSWYLANRRHTRNWNLNSGMTQIKVEQKIADICKIPTTFPRL